MSEFFENLPRMMTRYGREIESATSGSNVGVTVHDYVVDVVGPKGKKLSIGLKKAEGNPKAYSAWVNIYDGDRVKSDVFHVRDGHVLNAFDYTAQRTLKAGFRKMHSWVEKAKNEALREISGAKKIRG